MTKLVEIVLKTEVWIDAEEDPNDALEYVAENIKDLDYIIVSTNVRDVIITKDGYALDE